MFIQVLLIVTPRKKMLFEFAGPILETLFLRANVSESEHLAIGNGSFAVHGVATIHAEILVLVRGFDVQISRDPAFFQVDGRV